MSTFTVTPIFGNGFKNRAIQRIKADAERAKAAYPGVAEQRSLAVLNPRSGARKNRQTTGEYIGGHRMYVRDQGTSVKLETRNLASYSRIIENGSSSHVMDNQSIVFPGTVGGSRPRGVTGIDVGGGGIPVHLRFTKKRYIEHPGTKAYHIARDSLKQVVAENFGDGTFKRR